MPSAADLAEFNRLLATVVERGTSLEDGFEEMREQLSSAAMRDAALAVGRALREGTPLLEALARVPAVFPPDYCALVRAGQKGGALAAILRGVETYHALRARAARSARRLTVNLLAGLGVCVAVCGVLLTVAPRFRTMFDQLGMRELPLPTELLIRISESGLATGGAALGGALAALVAWWVLAKVIARGGLVYLIPVWGRLAASRDLATVCTVLSLRLAAGAPVTEALDDARAAVPNRRVKRILARACARVGEGEPLSSAFFYEGFFPRTLSWALSLGEQRADVPGVLGAFGRLYTAQVERDFDVALVLLAPLGVLAVANVVAVCVLGLLLPILEVQRRLAGE